jgi:choloylglycine hydrolase
MKQNKKVLIMTLLGFIILVGIFVNSIHACTGIRLIATNGSVTYGRTMEWGAFDPNSRVAIIPRGYSFTGLTPGRCT